MILLAQLSLNIKIIKKGAKVPSIGIRKMHARSTLGWVIIWDVKGCMICTFHRPVVLKLTYNRISTLKGIVGARFDEAKLPDCDLT